MPCAVVVNLTSHRERTIVESVIGVSVAWIVRIIYYAKSIVYLVGCWMVFEFSHPSILIILYNFIVFSTDHCPWMNNCVGTANMSKL